MIIDVSKFLAWCKLGPRSDWEALLNTNLLPGYVRRLEEGGVGPEGITGKLDTLSSALTYLKETYFNTQSENQ